MRALAVGSWQLARCDAWEACVSPCRVSCARVCVCVCVCWGGRGQGGGTVHGQRGRAIRDEPGLLRLALVLKVLQRDPLQLDAHACRDAGLTAGGRHAGGYAHHLCRFDLWVTVTHARESRTRKRAQTTCTPCRCEWLVTTATRTRHVRTHHTRVQGNSKVHTRMANTHHFNAWLLSTLMRHSFPLPLTRPNKPPHVI